MDDEPLFVPDENQKSVLSEVSANAPITRQKLAAVLGLSKRDTDNAINGLVVAGAIRATTDNDTFALGAEAATYLS